MPQNRKKQEIIVDNHRNKNGQDAVETAILADSEIAPRGFEPLKANQEPVINNELTKSQKPVLDTCLDKILQIHTDLEQIIKLWPTLPEHIKTAVTVLVKTNPQ